MDRDELIDCVDPGARGLRFLHLVAEALRKVPIAEFGRAVQLLERSRARHKSGCM